MNVSGCFSKTKVGCAHDFRNYSCNFDFLEKEIFFIDRPHYNLMIDLLIESSNS